MYNKIPSLLYNKYIYRPVTKLLLGKCGLNFKLGYSSELLNPKYFEIGDNFYSGPYGYFVTNKNNPVQIGNSVMFGPYCKIIGGNHNKSYNESHLYYNKDIDHMQSKILIEDGVWIGASTVILSGAKICEGTIIGAMSLVNNYVPPYTVAVGIPVKKLKRRFDRIEDMHLMLANVKSKYTIDEIIDIYKLFDIAY